MTHGSYLVDVDAAAVAVSAAVAVTITVTAVVGGATTLICGIPRAGSENILGGTTITNHSEEYECLGPN